MPLTVTPLSPVFCARVEGVDLVRGLTDAEFAKIRRALDEHSVLILPDQPMDDDQQIAFSGRFGKMEPTISVNPAKGTLFARQSNLDIETGLPIPPDDRRMHYQKANMLWHADSTFKPVTSLCSLLSARIVPPEGGATEFASTRAAYESLTPEEQAGLEGLVVAHSLMRSREQVGFSFTEEERRETPAVTHTLVRSNPVTGRKSVLIGAHASHIEGWPVERGRALLADLLARATRPEHTWRHEWRQGDLVIWDNRAALHRATPYDTVRHKRLMQRITISSGEPAFA
jgi:alpha-ketoglutarate-dependent 2,4-dichlorophenoxyacetate dioxygenase